jgi:hypothetical protein
MLIDVKHAETTYQVNLDQVWVWVRLERELALTITQAQQKMGEGSTHVITYAIWLASDVEVTYDQWLKDLKEFEVLDDSPKATRKARSATT